jgi:hypothetical protein
MASLVEDLASDLARSNAVVLLGAGVSVAATDGSPLASWTGLLHHGVDHCVKVVSSLPLNWAETLRSQIDSGDSFFLVQAATDISHRLGYPTGGDYREWLRTTVGSLELVNPALVDAVLALGAQIATTNYDSLVEKRSQLPAVTWRDSYRVQRVLRGDEQAVLHLHGHWEAPESVVLGVRSYEDMLRDEAAKLALRNLVWLRTLVFIGFGAGLGDPNFGELLKWSRPILAQSGYRHYRLVLESEVETAKKQHEEERVSVIPFGRRHEDLPAFLRRLVQHRQPSGAKSATTTSLGSDFQSRLVDIRARQASLAPAEYLRALSQVALDLWQAGYKRTAWTTLDGPFSKHARTLDPNSRLQIGLGLADMMSKDGVPDRAHSVLQELVDDASSLSDGDAVKSAFAELQVRVFADLSGYDDSITGIERALDQAEEGSRDLLRARLAEIHLLRGTIDKALSVARTSRNEP